MIDYWRALPREARLFLSVLLVDFLGTGLTHAFLVVYLHQVRGFSLGLTGVLVGLTSLMSLIATFPTGSLVDRLGARRVGVAANVLIVSGEVVLAFAASVPLALLSVTLTGLGFGMAWAAFPAFAVSLVPVELRTRYFGIEFGLINLGIGLGGIVGGLVLSGLGSFQTMYLIDAATTCVTVGLLLGPLRAFGAPATSEPDSEVAPASYREVLRTRGVAPLLVFTVLATLVGYAQLSSGMVAYATDVAGVGTRWIGFAYAANTGIIVVLQLVLMPVIERVRRTRAMATMGLVWAVAWACLGLAGAATGSVVPGLLVVACAGIFAVGETMLTPLIPAMVNDLADDRNRGRASAVSAFGQQLPSAVGPPVAGALLGAGLHTEYVGLLVAGALGCSLVARVVLEPRLPAYANRSADAVDPDFSPAARV